MAAWYHGLLDGFTAVDKSIGKGRGQAFKSRLVIKRAKTTARMKKNRGYQQWVITVISKMPHLSKPQAVVLAMWSFGMVMTGSCGVSTVSVFLATLLGKKENTVRQQCPRMVER